MSQDASQPRRGPWPSRPPDGIIGLKITVASRETSLGVDHPDTLSTVNDLANFLYQQNNLDEALPLYERALKGRETSLGVDHPDTLRTANDLAILKNKLGIK